MDTSTVYSLEGTGDPALLPMRDVPGEDELATSSDYDGNEMSCPTFDSHLQYHFPPQTQAFSVTINVTLISLQKPKKPSRNHLAAADSGIKILLIRPD